MLISVAIIEDDVHYNRALQKIIDNEQGMFCSGQYFDGNSVLQDCGQWDADVAIVDINLKDMQGVELVERLRHTGTQFIMCTCYDDDQNIVESLKAGASGYLLKGERMDKIISSIREVFQGGVPMTSSVARKILQQFDRPEKSVAEQKLTKTEIEVMRWMAQGLSYKMIAEKQYVSIDTIRKHVANIYRKLGVNNKVDAINMLNQRQ